MTTSILYIEKEKTGYGHWLITVTLDNGAVIKDTTTDSRAIDSWDEVNDDYEQGGQIELTKSVCADYEKENEVEIDYSSLIID